MKALQVLPLLSLATAALGNVIPHQKPTIKSTGLSPKTSGEVATPKIYTVATATTEIATPIQSPVSISSEVTSAAQAYNQLAKRGTSINSADYTAIGQTQEVTGGTIVREDKNTVSITGSIKCDASKDASAQTVNSVDNRGTVVAGPNTSEVHNAADTVLKAGQHNDKILISNVDATKDNISLEGYDKNKITVSDPEKRTDVPALAGQAGDQYVQVIKHDGKEIAFVGYTNGNPITLDNINANGGSPATTTQPTTPVTVPTSSVPTASETSASTTSGASTSTAPSSTAPSDTENSGVREMASKGWLSAITLGAIAFLIH